MFLKKPSTKTTLSALLSVVLFSGIIHSANAVERHGLSAFGDLKYAKDFKNFSYVVPLAPKGGKLSMIGTAGLTTFNSFNDMIIKGDAAQGLEYLYDSLMVRAQDEPDAVYGLVAKSANVARDKSSVTFTLRPEARFADGSKLTSADLVFSFNILKKKGHPRLSSGLRDVTSAKALGGYKVRYTFKGKLVRDLPLVVAQLPILPKAWWERREFDKTSLDKPLGSGPYTIGSFKPGSYVSFLRRKDYWAKDLPVNKGRYNFDELRYEYFRDRTAEFEALKSGNFDLREEFTSRVWANDYKLNAVKSGRLVRLDLDDKRPSGAQGFFINLRRKKFADKRVRQALDLAFDYEWTNKNMFHGLYQRTQSFFENSVMKAKGLPSRGEVLLLKPFEKQLPPEIFTHAPYIPPVTDGSGQNRKNLRAAKALLQQAGWRVKKEVVKGECGTFCSILKAIGLKSDSKQSVLRNADNEAFEITFLIDSPSFKRIISPYIKNLKRLGIQGKIRMVDNAQYQERIKSFDFDMTTERYVLGMTPSVAMRNYWGSRAADQKGSYNLSGIKNPVIDALIEKIIAAPSRESLVTASRALDRILRNGHYWVPHWYKAGHWLAYWNKFSRPVTKPPYARGVIDLWWYDVKKAKQLGNKK